MDWQTPLALVLAVAGALYALTRWLKPLQALRKSRSCRSETSCATETLLQIEDR